MVLYAKKIFLCFDGTGNDENAEINEVTTGKLFWKKKVKGEYDENSGISNILRMHIMAGGSINNEFAEVPGQISLYMQGVGAMDDSKKINQAIGDFTHQEDKMMEILVPKYEEGDTLYIFGFSRGAAAARDFVSRLGKDGIEKDGKKYEPTVRFVGVWDTVATDLKIEAKEIIKRGITNEGHPTPDDLGEVDDVISDKVEKVVHLCQLDDPRQFSTMPYAPTLMTPDDRVTEIWFPGTHGDSSVGSFTEGISDTALEFMINRMKEMDDPPTFLTAEEVKLEALEGVPDYIDGVDERQLYKEYMEIVCGFDNVSWPGNLPKRRSPRILGRYAGNGEIDKTAEISVHESVYDHLKDYCDKGGKMYTWEHPYNPNLKDANFKVYGQDMKEIPEKTKALKELVESKEIEEKFAKTMDE